MKSLPFAHRLQTGAAASRARLTHAAPTLATLLMLALACVVGVRWGIALLAPAPLPVPETATATPIASTQGQALFGGATAAGGPGRVVLRGVLAEGGEGVAVVSIDGAPPRVVRQGGELAPGLRLVGIASRSITLERAGARETINLAAPRRDTQNARQPSGAPGTPGAPMPPTAQPAPGAAPRP